MEEQGVVNGHLNKASKQEIIKELLKQINQSPIKKINVMEVCGTHTRAIYQYGIHSLVETKIHLISGPGCPVCVTSEDYIDKAIRLLQYPEVILVTFGDMMKVKGSKDNLICQKENGKDIRVVYSPLDAISLAENNQDREVVFLAVGFETTAPIIALAVKITRAKSLKNITFLVGLKRMEPVLHFILSDSNHNIQGILCPGHVAAVKGADYFRFITEQYHIPAVIAGFEEMDIIRALHALLLQQETNETGFLNLYKSCVTTAGNERANQWMDEIYSYQDEEWRGIGIIKNSGLALKREFECYDAGFKFGISHQYEIKERPEFSETSYARNSKKFCECSKILLGKKRPEECSCFGTVCTPEHPIGPCMVSSEGSCSVTYHYK